MKNLSVITTPINYDFIKRESSHNTSNLPFTRQNIILENLKKNHNFNLKITNKTFPEIEQIILNSNMIDKDYITFLQNAYTSYINNGKNDDYTSLYDQGLVAYYFNKKSTITNNLLQILPFYLQCGIFTNDYCTSIFDYTYENALRTAYNSYIVSKLELSNDELIYCCNVYPGHHSTNSCYNGYCFLNNAAICAKLLLNKYNKICILDLDYHHGDGTQEIFKHDENVITISIHGDPSNTYPFYSGYFEENTNDNYNYPLSKNASYEEYVETLTSILHMINTLTVNILIISFGSDTFNEDPQGYFNLMLDDYKKIGNIIKDNINMPIVVMQEGGYDLNNVGTIVNNFITGLK